MTVLKELNIDNYSIDDLFDIISIEKGDFFEALNVIDEYIDKYDESGDTIMSNFFLKMKEKINEFISENNINVQEKDNNKEFIDEWNNATHSEKIILKQKQKELTDINTVNIGKVRGFDIDRKSPDLLSKEQIQQNIAFENYQNKRDNNIEYIKYNQLNPDDSIKNITNITENTEVNTVGFNYSEEDEDKNMYMLGFTKSELPVFEQDTNSSSNFRFINKFKKIDNISNINSLNKSTLKRSLIFDSQFRPLGSQVNDFHIDLTEPLVNVISLKMESYQFIYSIYNIDDMNGTNIFYVTDTSNNFHSIKVDQGLYTSPELLINEINSKITTFFTNSTLFHNSYPYITDFNELIIFSYNSNNGKTTVRIKNIFKYLKFFDLEVVAGQSKVNFNLGYFLGFRKFFKNNPLGLGYYLIEQQGEGSIDTEVTTYVLDNTFNTIISEGIIDIQQPKYVILSIDDYNQNRLNQNVITASDGTNNTVPLRNLLECNPEDLGNLQVPVNPRRKSLASLYANNEQILDTVNELRKQSSRNIPAAIPDIFSMIPLDTNRTLGALISSRGINFGINKRDYFGPVNINRFRIRLFDERGNSINLNNTDYSFSILVERIYDQNKKEQIT